MWALDVLDDDSIWFQLKQRIDDENKKKKKRKRRIRRSPFSIVSSIEINDSSHENRYLHEAEVLFISLYIIINHH